MAALDYWYLLPAAAFAGFITAVCGIGGGILFLPVMVWAVGAQQAVPLLTCMLLVSNLTRVTLNWRHIDWAVARNYVGGAIPGALGGSFIFISASGDFLRVGIGIFLIASVVFHRLVNKRVPRTPRWFFAPLGAVTGFFSAIWGALGPLPAPFLANYGLRTAAFVGTAGVGALTMHLTKIIVYRNFGFLSNELLPMAAALAICGMVGSALGKLVLNRLTPDRFMLILDILLVLLGAIFLVK